MTVIAAVRHDGRVYMAGDSAGVGGLSLSIRADPKVFIRDQYVFGFTSSFRMGQILAHAFQPPAPPEDESALFGFMVTTFVNTLRDAFKSGGFTASGPGPDQGGCFLVGVHGRLFQIEGDFQVGGPLDPFDAVGCGADLARGALFATQDMGLEPHQRLTLAMRAAENGSAGVRGPFALVVR